MTQYSSYGIKIGMDIDVSKGILDKDGFFTRTLKNDFLAAVFRPSKVN